MLGQSARIKQKQREKSKISMTIRSNIRENNKKEVYKMLCLKHGVSVPIKTGQYKGYERERVIIGVQSTDDLVTHTGKTKFSPLSIALVISTGDIYALDNNDTWIKQPNMNISITL